MSLISRLTTWVSGQILKSADQNGEFNNIVNVLNNLDSATTSWTNVKGATINGTTSVTGVTVNGSTNLQKAGVNTLGIIQVSTGNMGNAFSTSSTTYVAATGSGFSFTPVSASSTIYLFASGLLSVDNPNTHTTFSTIMNNTTSLHAAGSGLAGTSDGLMAITSEYATMVTMFAKQASPGTSAQTYNVGVKVNTGAATGQWNNGNNALGWWLGIEVL